MATVTLALAQACLSPSSEKPTESVTTALACILVAPPTHAMRGYAQTLYTIPVTHEA